MPMMTPLALWRHSPVICVIRHALLASRGSILAVLANNQLMNAPAPEQPGEKGAPRRLRLRYAGTCLRCGKGLTKGTEALYDAATRTVRCVVCEAMLEPDAVLPDDSGVAGSSAQREYDRRHVAREERVRRRLGNTLGNVVLAITDDPQSTRAWARGAKGEQMLAEALQDVPDLRLLHDRRVPHTKGNIDHVLVSSAGVFVVDAKLYKGLIEVRDVGGLFKTDKRLYVGHRDCSELATSMAWQVEAVQLAITAAGIVPSPPVTPVLCFVDGDWPLLWPPTEFRGVRLEGKRSIKKLITATQILDTQAIAGVYHSLAIAFPPK